MGETMDERSAFHHDGIPDKWDIGDGELNAVWEGSRLIISVEEEKAVDSYNATFNCSSAFDRKSAERFARWILDSLNA